MTEPTVTLFGPIDTILMPYVEYVLLLLVLANLVTRKMEFEQIKTQAREGAGAISHHPAHLATSWILVLTSLYYVTVHFHAGMVLSTLVLGTFGADFFEFEARKVEARQDLTIEQPKAALVISTLMFLYAAYDSLFFLIKDYWNLVV
ncbi:MAG: hypothetical protein ABEI52_12810 [Halobacteriaceae archaeon]